MDGESELPEGWEKTSLKNIGFWSTGGTPSRKNPEYFNGNIPWIKSGDLPDGHITSTEEKITKEGLDSCSAKILPKGTISIALYGATIGKLGILDFESSTNQACANCQVINDLINRDFLFYFLLNERNNFIKTGQGGAQPNLTNQIIRDWVIPLPPLAEQRRIVAAVGALLARVNASRERLDRVPGLLKAFRQAVLAAACSGRLTEGWREENYQRLNRPEIDNAKFPEIIEFYQFGVPNHWIWTSIKNVLHYVQYGLSIKADADEQTGIPILRMGNIQDGLLNFDDLKYIQATQEELSQFYLDSGDVLFNRTNSPELVGKSAVYDVDKKMTFASYLIRIKVNQELLFSKYLNYWINSNWGREWARKVRTDGVSQSNINGKKLQQMPIPLPPLPEQHEIVRRVESLFTLTDHIEQRVAIGKERADRLTQAILAKAFRGELVPTEAELARSEGREYEPAEVLLERIKKNQEMSGGKSKRKTRIPRTKEPV